MSLTFSRCYDVENKMEAKLSVPIEILITLLLILINGVFSMSEMAVVSARKARLQQQAEQGSAGAKAALALSSSPNEFLSTVQIGITLVGTLAGAFSGSTLARHLTPHMEKLPLIGPYSETASLGLVVVVITFLTLVLGELAPKSLALNNAEKIAVRVAIPMGWLAWVATPLVNFLAFFTDGVLRLIGVKASTEPPITAEEIQILIEQGTQAGIFEAVEQDIVQNALRIDDLRVTSLMTLRPEIVMLDVAAPLEDNIHKMLDERHTRYPVYEGDTFNVIGVLDVKDMWEKMCRTEPIEIRTLLTKPLFLPENTTALDAMEQMKEENIHLALIMDEHSHIQGLITPNDILNAIVGDIAPDEDDEAESPQIIQREDGSWLVDGILSIEDFKEQFKVDLRSEDEKIGYQTLGGFIMSQLERVPQAADHFEWNNIWFEVMDMDGRRVDKVLVKLPAPATEISPSE